MSNAALIRLIVALARLAGITPIELAAMYSDTAGCQQFYDAIRQTIAKSATGTIV